MNKKKDAFEKLPGPDLKTFKTALKKAKRIVLSTHQLPDGDGLGAEMALFHYLKKVGKSCRILNPDPLPPRYFILDPKRVVLFEDPSSLQKDVDLWIIVDTNDPLRLGSLWNPLSTSAKKIVFLDHHSPLQVRLPAHASLISDQTSSSIGELLYRLFRELKLAPLDRSIFQGLYVSVMTDTNSFRYRGTTPLAHQIAAEALEFGIDPEGIYQSIFSSKKVSHLRLLGVVLQKTKVAAHGKIAWIELTKSLRKKYRASADDTQSFLNLLLLIKEAEVICLFREEDNQQVRLSIRSKGKVSIHQVATELGGGGHKYSAGAAVSLPLDQVVQTVIRKIKKTLKEIEP